MNRYPAASPDTATEAPATSHTPSTDRSAPAQRRLAIRPPKATRSAIIDITGIVPMMMDASEALTLRTPLFSK
jgi:hypothetical protein